MGRKKLTEDIKKKRVTFKLKPDVIKQIHEIAILKNIKVVHVIETCLFTEKTIETLITEK